MKISRWIYVPLFFALWYALIFYFFSSSFSVTYWFIYGTAMGAFILYFSDRRAKKISKNSGDKRAFEVYQKREIVLLTNYEKTFDLCRAAILSLKWCVINKEDLESGVIKAKGGFRGEIMRNTLMILAVLFFTAIFGGSVNAQVVNNSNKTETNIQKQDYDQNIQVKKKPQPRVSRDCNQSSGRTRILVTFDKSEKITEVEIISTSGCFGFDQNALRAAKSIKFKAAMKDGEPVTVKKQVEYAYMIGARGF